MNVHLQCGLYIGVTQNFRQRFDIHAYLETAGFKLAHLWGFLWGNAFFPEVVPGYTPDTALTARYVQMASMDIGFPIRVLT